MKMYNSVAAIRVSSTKQGLQGDSPEDQQLQIENKAKLIGVDTSNIKYFTFIQSASGIIQPSQEAIDFCKENQGKIKYFFIKSIDRFTRAGVYPYLQLKAQLIRYGVQLVDVLGVINEQRINTLEHLGVEYRWSVYNPSFANELLKVEEAKNEVSTILTRLIGAEIRYVRMGYRVRQAPMGYKNLKTETADGMRVILIPHPDEAQWFIRMFELRIQGNLSDEEIISEINGLGFKSRILKVHDKIERTKVINHRGGLPLTVKQFQKYIQNPIYAGINTEKWVEGKPIKCHFDGLVTIEMFNKANRGKIMIVEDGDTIRIYKRKLPEWLVKKNKDNPLFAYKQQVLCPKCQNPLLGSAPQNKAGDHIPRYHCGKTKFRNHKYWSVNKKIFDKTISDFVHNIKFSEKFKKRLEEIVLEEWEKRSQKLVSDTIGLREQVNKVDFDILQLKERIKQLTSTTVIQMMESDIEGLVQQKTMLIANCNKKEDEDVDIQTLINHTKYLMEHLEELLLGGSDPLKNAALFGLIFDQSPTYDDLVNRTPVLSPLFQLNEDFNSSNSLSVRRQGLEP